MDILNRTAISLIVFALFMFRLALAKAMLQIQDHSSIEFVGKEDKDKESLRFVKDDTGCYVRLAEAGTRTINMQASDCLVSMNTKSFDVLGWDKEVYWEKIHKWENMCNWLTVAFEDFRGA